MTSWLRRKSFRVRMGALVAAAVGVAVVLTALASYFAVRHQLYSQVDSSLNAEMAAAQLSAPRRIFDPNTVAGILRHYNNSLLQVIGPDQSVVYPDPTIGPALPVSVEDAALAANGGSSIRTVTYEGEPYRLITQGGTLSSTAGTPLAIQIARPLTDINRSLAELRLILWIVGLTGMGVAVVLGYIVGRATIRPVERLTAAAEHVATTLDLDSTIEVTGEDELGRLARSFNAMLAALAASRQQQAQLISDAGHELRTPLTSLRTNIEVLLRVRDLPEPDRAELLKDVNSQLEEMTTLVGDVVELAREDEAQPEPIEVRFDSLVARAIERARRRAPSLTFDVQLTPGSVRGQPVLLERAVLNVLDNAVKWSPPVGTIWIRLRRQDVWTLDIRDHGPGIAAADLPRVFDRFYRAESARSLPGSGLGLAIVQQVVISHGGNVQVSTAPRGGTLVHIELPIVVEHEPAEVAGETEPPVYYSPEAGRTPAEPAGATGPIDKESFGPDPGQTWPARPPAMASPARAPDPGLAPASDPWAAPGPAPAPHPGAAPGPAPAPIPGAAPGPAPAPTPGAAPGPAPAPEPGAAPGPASAPNPYGDPAAPWEPDEEVPAASASGRFSWFTRRS
jgi:two-component system sensor histidine kinase MprB